ncbi:hypothetical protein VCHC41A1_1365, partial [Vibrio cholerae HC-41A1]
MAYFLSNHQVILPE